MPQDQSNNENNFHQQPKKKSLSKIMIWVFIITVIIIAGFVLDRTNILRRNKEAPESEAVQQEKVLKKKEDNAINYIIKPGNTFDTIMGKYNVEPVDRIAIFEVAKDIYDLSTLKAGQSLKLTLKDNPGLIKLEYEYDDENILIVERSEEGFQSRNELIEYDIEINKASGEIASSLFETAAEQGVEDGVIMEITNILAWQVDFVSDVRTGDSFKVVYEKRYRNGEYVDYGRVLGVEFTNQGKESWAIYFEDPEGTKGYYDLEGGSTKKAFLKSPLQYKYISSGYTNSRFHPVLKRYLPHRAIDYAARAGTPIAAVGKGRVTYAGRKGGDGVFVEIRHNKGYTTQYSHLQNIAKGIKVGTQVEQNDIIGYVGSTGYSTGPHLQYAMKKDGVAVNPLEVDQPSADPIQEVFLDDFLSTASQIKQKLNE